MGGFVLGGGAMLNGKPLENHINKKTVVKAFDDFIGNIEQGLESPKSLYYDAEGSMNLLITRIIAFFMNRMVKKNLKSYGYSLDYKSPYLTGKE